MVSHGKPRALIWTMGLAVVMAGLSCGLSCSIRQERACSRWGRRPATKGAPVERSRLRAQQWTPTSFGPKGDALSFDVGRSPTTRAHRAAPKIPGFVQPGSRRTMNAAHSTPK